MPVSYTHLDVYKRQHVYNVVNTPTSVMQKLRGNYMSMIFQEPMTSLNPVLRIGEQVDEVIALHNPDMTKDDVKRCV